MDIQNPLGCFSSNASSPSREHKAGNGYTVAAATARGRALDFRMFPDSDIERDRLDAVSQTPDDNGNVCCWRRRRRCTNPDCVNPASGQPYRFTKVDRELWNCPLCGQDRHCRRLVPLPNRGCHQHGGATPVGWELPQTKTGEYSKYLRIDSMREDYERLLASSQLCSLDDGIALLKAHLNELVAQYGGVSRELLQRMQKNRRQYGRELRRPSPSPERVRELDREMEQMVEEGASAYSVMRDYKDTISQVCRLIEARDKHMQMERATITSDKAWMLLSFVEETFRLGAEMTVDVVDEEYIRRQCHLLGVDFTSLSHERIRELIINYRGERNEDKRRMLAYASKRFRKLADEGIIPNGGSRK